MWRNIKIGRRVRVAALICLICTGLLSGCVKTAGKIAGELKPDSNVVAATKANFNNYKVRRIAIVPFENQSEDEEAGFKVASYVYDRLSRHKEYEVSPPLKIEGEGLRIEFLRPRLRERTEGPAAPLRATKEKKVESAPQPSPEVQFDALITGRVLRYQAREGNFLFALEAASVAYEIYLVSVEDGAILWKASYDETQQPLDQNLLLLDRYLKGGLWWQTSDSMTRVGMERVMKTFPGVKTERPPAKPE